MSLFSLGSEKRAITFRDLAIDISGETYTGLTFIVRLLSYEELIKINSIKQEDPEIAFLLEEDVFELVLDHIVGLPLESGIDIDYMEAGIISTISAGVMYASNFYFNNVHAGIQRGLTESTIFDQMQLVVAKNFNIQYKDVLLMPIDELARKFALFQTTFPDQALAFDNEQH